MFGFSFPENFRHPYESRSITEFWRRWHISLGTWFREYVYIPLGGNRKGVGRQIVNLGVVWLLTGLWHGASFNFVLWGIYYGVLLVLEKFFWKKWLEKIPSFFCHLYVMLLVMIGWSLFAWQDMADSTSYLRTMFLLGNNANGNSLWDTQTLYLLSSYLLLLIVAVVGSTSFPKKFADHFFVFRNDIARGVAEILFVVTVWVACVAMLVNSSYNPFLYFRF
jgi:alginate O-acetyltransferase complex protein AlgI